MKKTRKELMQELNKLLNVSYNWGRINSLDLQRLVDAIKDKCWMVLNKDKGWMVLK